MTLEREPMTLRREPMTLQRSCRYLPAGALKAPRKTRKPMSPLASKARAAVDLTAFS